MNLHLIKLISAIIILLSAITEIIAPIRLCEVQGTCFKCPDGHFSHFLCRSNVDCFAGEYCLQQRGFCCPGDGFSAGKGSQLENGTTPASLLCPDGSSWDRMCKTDADCLFRDELCAEGRCCPSCRQRRLQALKELRNFGSSAGGRDAADEFIPQCSDDGKHFRPMQCTGGSGECFCVDKLGRHQHSRKRDRGSRRQPINCTNLREEEESEANNNSKGQGLTRVALNRDRWAVAGANDPQQSLEPTVPDERSPKQPQQPQHCADPLREFRHCGSACPISCATRTMPRCPQEQCMQGCFCRLPYVILDAGDPNGSRCVLPAECPLLQFTPELDQWNGGFFPANQYQQQQQQQYSMTPLLPSAPPGSNRVGKCNDPLKNWQSCGSACPAGCGRMNPAVLADCSAHCVSGCFCRVPYVLQNPVDPANSACILPQQCVPSLPPQMPPLLSAAAEAQLCKPSRNQSWTGCFSRKCSRSCGEWPPFCVPDDCQPGCECQPPAVVRDKSATVWECVLPEDCPRQRKKSGKTAEEEQETTAVKAAAADEKEKCEDQRKEFLSCGSSCPLGCDRLDQPLRQCSPCVSGCFCRNGFVFANASDWRTSGCVPLEECPSAAANKAQDQPPAPVKATTITAIQHVEGVPQPPICPANALDRDGKLCLNDGECGTQRRCCSSSSSSTPNNTSAIVASAARCTCRDPNALWTDCGPLCVDHCAQSARRLCPGPCRPGCFCPPGFVKRTADPDSECVPVAQCAVGGEESIDVSDEEKACGEALASASLYTRDGMRIGRLVARPERPAAGAATRRIRLSGDFAPPSIPPLLLNAGLVLSIHQFSDTTINGCAGVGLPLRLRLVEGNGAENDSGGGGGKTVEELPAIRRENGISFGLDQRIEWPDPIGQGTNPLIGHSMVLQQVAGDEQYRSVIACAVLGIAPSC